jgi:AcrR family transcriptional regulator
MATTITRGERALVTRRRMVQAAYALFCEKGYLGTTMKAIAEDAGVAVQTLYYTFHTKAEILGEALGAAVVGFDAWREPPSDPDVSELLPWHWWWPDFEAAPSAAEALDVFVVNGVRVLERVGPLVVAMNAVTGDADAERVVQLGEKRRLEAYRLVVRALHRKSGGLRPGLSEAAATDIAFALFSADSYRALAGRGWSTARCTRFFGELLSAQLLQSDS